MSKTFNNFSQNGSKALPNLQGNFSVSPVPNKNLAKHMIEMGAVQAGINGVSGNKGFNLP